MNEAAEVDSLTVFLQPASDLINLRTFEETLERFGFSKDDKINRRDLVQIYRRVEKDMENEIYRLAHTARYDEAKEMRGRLTNIRAAFDNLQTNAVKTTHREQSMQFDTANKELHGKMKQQHSDIERNVEQSCDNERSLQQRFHEIQQENLELKISRTARPHMKYSKRMIELFKAEHELIKLNQYDEARKVRRMIDKMMPAEEKKFNDAFDDSIESMRQNLAKTQETDRARLQEQLLRTKWNDIRDRERELNM